MNNKFHKTNMHYKLCIYKCVMKHLLRLFILLVLFGFISCTFESDGLYLDELGDVKNLYDHYVDEYGNEGIVVSIRHGYSSEYKKKILKAVIVVSTDEFYGEWGPMGELVMKKDSMDYYAVEKGTYGLAVLQSMKSIGIEKFPAQEWCDMKNKGKLPYAGSWHLPTDYEYSIAFYNLPSLNAAIYDADGDVVDEDALYWTCVEDFDGYMVINNTVSDYDKENRAAVMTADGYTYVDKDRWIKKNKYHVRAVKYIYYHY